MAKRKRASFTADKRGQQMDFSKWFARYKQAAYLQQIGKQRQVCPSEKVIRLCNRL